MAANCIDFRAYTIAVSFAVLPSFGLNSHTLPYLFSSIDSIPLAHRPQFIRGDCAFGNDPVMTACEERLLPYLFKLKQTPYVKHFISQQMTEGEWENAGQGWQGSSGQLKLMGWEKSRRSLFCVEK